MGGGATSFQGSGLHRCGGCRCPRSKGVTSMRRFLPLLAVGSLLMPGFSGGILLAQNQTAPPAVSAPAPAASPTQRPVHVPNPQHQAKKMAKELGLTPDQVSKIEP